MANKFCLFFWLAAGAPRTSLSVHPMDHGQTFVYSVPKKACWTAFVFWETYKAKERKKRKEAPYRGMN
jgi:hypothetical protein